MYLLARGDADLEDSRINHDGVPFTTFPDLGRVLNRLFGGGKDEFPPGTAGQIRKEVQRSSNQSALVVRYVGPLNWDPLPGVHAREDQSTSVRLWIQFDRIAEQGPRPPVERMFQSIL